MLNVNQGEFYRCAKWKSHHSLGLKWILNALLLKCLRMKRKIKRLSILLHVSCFSSAFTFMHEHGCTRKVWLPGACYYSSKKAQWWDYIPRLWWVNCETRCIYWAEQITMIITRLQTHKCALEECPYIEKWGNLRGQTNSNSNEELCALC